MILFRILRILFVLAKYNLGRFGGKPKYSFLPVYVPALFLLLPFLCLGRLFGKRLPPEQSLRLALEELGPIFIKFGQILSTRSDLFRPRLIEELSKLQDKVTPCPTEKIKDEIRKSLGGEPETFFSHFNEKPDASASVAQVHRACLKKENIEVVIKVIKPGIQKAIAKDIRLLRFVAFVITNILKGGERLRLREVINEFEHTLAGELDMQLEGSNATQLARNFADSELLIVPKIYWDYSGDKVLVMERMDGIPIDEVDELKRRGVNLRVLAEKGVNIFFMQVFRDSFFHADMHPGNIFVGTDNPQDPVYKGVDFGIMGSLSDTDKKYLALNFLAFFNRDYRRVAALHINCGWVSPETRIEQLEAAVRSVCEPIFAKSLEEISFGKVLTRLLYTAARFNMEVQPQLLLLQKTLINVEGLGRKLYPQLNVWDTAKPYLAEWMKQETGPKHLFGEIRRLYPELLLRLPDLAANSLFLLEQSTRRELAGRREEPKIKKMRKKLVFYKRLFYITATMAVLASIALIASEILGVL